MIPKCIDKYKVKESLKKGFERILVLLIVHFNDVSYINCDKLL